jgi:hypothetical protein
LARLEESPEVPLRPRPLGEMASLAVALLKSAKENLLQSAFDNFCPKETELQKDKSHRII